MPKRVKVEYVKKDYGLNNGISLPQNITHHLFDGKHLFIAPDKASLISTVLIFLCLVWPLWAEPVLNLQLSEQLVLGKKDILFGGIASVCEDSSENLFVLDDKNFKVHKFSKNGEKLLSFGDRGDGPACFLSPHSLYITPKGNIVVNETRGFVSLFDGSGRFLKRIKIPVGLGLYFLNNDRFIGWIWKPDSKQQVLINQNGEILKSFFSVPMDAFSVNAADETGRMVMFNFFREEYTPFFVFDQNGDYSVLGVTCKYEILLMKGGEVISTIRRDIKPAAISGNEKEYFKGVINSDNKLPDFARKKFSKKIPCCKNHFIYLRVSDKYIWVFKVKEDVTLSSSLVPVDLYGLDTEFKGTLYTRGLPHYISSKYLYQSDTDDEDDLILTKYRYTLD